MFPEVKDAALMPVSILFDQSGHGRHLVQPDPDRQAHYVEDQQLGEMPCGNLAEKQPDHD